MDHYFSADYIVPVNGPPIPDGVVETDAEGVIKQVWKDRSAIPEQHKIKEYRGVIIPGFVNAHCHLELSHMLGKVPRSTGLIDFIKTVIKTREADVETITKAMEAADRQMQANGIVAVGDHANTSISRRVKEKSNLHYHTFLELLGFDPEKAEESLEKGLETKEQFDGLPVSLTPHAPYSVSKNLFRLLSKRGSGHPQTFSIHNQESEAENEFFRYRSGGFVDFYKWLGTDISYFKSHSKSSLQTIIPLLPANSPVQLVHNTFTTSKDSSYVHRLNRKMYWCLCPQANLYIENSLPKIYNILYINQPITIGTDSLASNDRLCILSELKTIHSHYPDILLPELIRWATWNGAKFLGVTERYGSLEVGKQPGINLLQHTDGLSLTPDTTVTRLI